MESWLRLQRDGEQKTSEPSRGGQNRPAAAGFGALAFAAIPGPQNGPGGTGGTAATVTLRSDEVPFGTDDPHGATPVSIADEGVLRLLVEELSVGRRQVETGRLQVRRTTRARIAEVDEELELVEAQVERVPVGAYVEVRPEVRETEDEIVIPVIEEVVVVERRLMLREEIRIRKVRRSERHREQVTLRAQEADILRLPPRAPATEE
jgi:hypothetical protein